MRIDHRVRERASKPPNGKYTMRYKEGDKTYFTKEFNLWNNMYNRVKSKARHLSDPKYAECGLDFTSYESFVEWCRVQVGFDQEGWVIDKDILCDVMGIGKVYSPTTCVFIPILINSFLTFRNSKNSTGYSGVSKINSEGYNANFMACCTNLNGRNTTLGRTDTVEEAYTLYRKHKIALAARLADQYEGYVDNRVVDYLRNFEKYIDNLAIIAKKEM